MNKIDYQSLFAPKFFFYLLSLILGILCLNQAVIGWLGFFTLGLIFLIQVEFLFQKIKIRRPRGALIYSFFFVLSYYILSLSILYYITGLNRIIISVWLGISFVPLIRHSLITREGLSFAQIKQQTSKLGEQIREVANNLFASLFFIIVVSLCSYLYSNPITNGSPTPWINVSNITFFIFFIIVFFIILGTLNKKSYKLINISFLFLIIGVVCLKFRLPYGFDSMIHQAALNHIIKFGQITPLTPFYTGQYVLEILINFFTNWNFLIIERYFVPVFFVIMTFMAGSYFLQKNVSGGHSKVLSAIVPLSILLLIPSQFFYTSPYSFSLLWAIVSVMGFLSFLKNNDSADYYFSLVAIMSSLLIHPFVGLSILPWIIVIPLIKNSSNVKKFFAFLLLTILSSVLVVFSFGLYNWLKGSEIYLINPSIYFKNFFALFNDPHWYIKSGSNFYLWLLYGYEKISFVFIILVLSFSLFIKKQKITNNIFYFLTFLLWLIFFYSQTPFLFVFLAAILFIYLNRKEEQSHTIIFLISCSSLLAAYCFFSVIEVSGYSTSDQVNYTSRLLQTSKWLLWPLVVLIVVDFFNLLSRKNIWLKLFFAFCFALILTANWYLTYPRNDQISRININNIRAIDYRAIDYIYQQEQGKLGYLVLANQLFAGGAIQKYGFGPYYNTSSSPIFYYSIPMGGEMNNTFEKIMSLENFDPSIIERIFNRVGVKKIYLITTDYWPLSSAAAQQINNYAQSVYTIDNKINIYIFSHVR